MQPQVVTNIPSFYDYFYCRFKIPFVKTFGHPKKDWLKISEGKKGWRLYRENHNNKSFFRLEAIEKLSKFVRGTA